MNFSKLSLVGLICAAVSAPTAAQEFDPYAYVKAQATFHYFDAERPNGDKKREDLATAVEGRAGFMFNPFFGAEARVGVGVNDAEVSNGQVGCHDKANVPFYGGAYGRAQVPLNNAAITPYALGGISHMRFRFSDSCGVLPVVEGELTEFAYGGGIDFNFDEYTAGLEVMKHNDVVTSFGFNFGVNLVPRYKGYSVRNAKTQRQRPLIVRIPGTISQ